MDDNARALHHKHVTILSGMVQSLRAEVARLQAERNSGEAVILAARQVVAGPYSGNVTKLAAALDAYDKALEGRA